MVDTRALQRLLRTTRQTPACVAARALASSETVVARTATIKRHLRDPADAGSTQGAVKRGAHGGSILIPCCQRAATAHHWQRVLGL